MRRSFACLVLVAIATALSASCTVASLDLSGKQCPCVAGYVCDTAANLCVPAGSGGDASIAEASVVDAKADVADASVAGKLTVSGLRPAWATPATIRWEWRVDGPGSAFRSYEVVVGKSAADVAARAAGVDVLRGNEHPELDLFDARGKRTNGPVDLWTVTDALPTATTRFVQVHATDTDGRTSSSSIEPFATLAGPGRTKVLFDGPARTAQPPAFQYRSPAGGEQHYALDVACPGTQTSCAQIGELVDLGVDLGTDGGQPSPYTAADFAKSFLTFDIEGNVASTSFESRVAIELGASCGGGPGVCRFRYTGFTQRRSGRTTVQVPLARLENDNGPLTYAIVQQKSFVVNALELSGTWKDGGTLRLYSARIRW